MAQALAAIATGGAGSEIAGALKEGTKPSAFASQQATSGTPQFGDYLKTLIPKPGQTRPAPTAQADLLQPYYKPKTDYFNL